MLSNRTFKAVKAYKETPETSPQSKFFDVFCSGRLAGRTCFL